MEVFPRVTATRCAGLFRVLGDPTRLCLVQALAPGQERSVGDLADAVQTTVPNASKHLLLLAQAGVLQRRRVGPNVWYALADPAVQQLVADVRGVLERALQQQQQELSAEAEVSG